MSLQKTESTIQKTHPEDNRMNPNSSKRVFHKSFDSVQSKLAIVGVP